jgi:hypothetical protein
MRLAATYPLLLMKNDISFKLVAVIVFAGVIVALFSPNHALQHTESATHDVAAVASQTE